MSTSTLTPEQLLRMREQLAAESESIQAGLAMASSNAAVVELDQSGTGRISRIDAMQQQAMAATQRERLLVRQRRIQAALQRLDGGGFGRCCQCELPLDVERLVADPAAPFCAECQQEIEERRRSG
jgi:DnaK suppressor protein